MDVASSHPAGAGPLEKTVLALCRSPSHTAVIPTNRLSKGTDTGLASHVWRSLCTR